MEMVDLSRLIYEGMPKIPVLPEVHVQRCFSLEKGHALNVTEISLPCHAGTHVDAPVHIVPNGKSIEQLPLESFVGPGAVIVGPAVIGDNTIVEPGAHIARSILWRSCYVGERAEVKAHFVVRLASEAAPPIAPEPEKVDVNTANVGELRSVDGIGLERAEEIVKYREEHGKIRDLNELDELPHFKDEPEGQRAPIKARLRV